MIPALFALGASVSWGLSDYSAGRLSRSVSVLQVLLVSQVAGLLLTFLVWISVRPGSIVGLEAWYAAAAGIASIVALGLLYAAMEVGKVSVVIPIASCGAIVPVLFGMTHGNNLSTVQACGVSAILVGIPFAARSRGEDGIEGNGGLVLSILAGLSSGVWFVLMDESSKNSPVSAALVMRLVSAFFIFLFVFGSGRQVICRENRKMSIFGSMALVGIFDAAAELFFTAASHGGILSVVGPLSSLYPVVTVALAIIVMRERVLPLQIFGSLLAVAGSVIASCS